MMKASTPSTARVGRTNIRKEAISKALKSPFSSGVFARFSLAIRSFSGVILIRFNISCFFIEMARNESSRLDFPEFRNGTRAFLSG